MPRHTTKSKGSSTPPPPPPTTTPPATSPTTGTSAMTPSGMFNGPQEGHRFLAPLESIAINPRNLREEWEYATDEFEEFADNVDNVELIQDPAVASIGAYLAKYPQFDGEFGPKIRWVLQAGERRYRARAAKLKPHEEIAVVLRDKLLEQGDFILFSENTMRKGWNPIQEALLIERIHEEEGLSYTEILEKLAGKGGAIKRLPDISKRRALLKLKDGPVRRAIIEGRLTLEPAYLLATKFATQEDIEGAWQYMQENNVTAKVAVSVLLHGQEQTATATDSAIPGASQIPVPRADAEVSAPRTPVTEPHPPAAPAPPQNFVDETPPTGGKVPAQPRQGNAEPELPESEPAAAAPGTTPDSGATGAVDPALTAARLDACTGLLSASIKAIPADEATRRVAVHTLLDASSATFQLALQLTGNPGPNPGENRDVFVRSIASDGHQGAFVLAYAVALAADELHLRRTGSALDERAVSFLLHLHREAGLELDGYDLDPVTISSTKP